MMAHGGPSYRTLVEISDMRSLSSPMNVSSRSTLSRRSMTDFQQPSTQHFMLTFPPGGQQSFGAEATSTYETFPSNESSSTPQPLFPTTQTGCRRTYKEILNQQEYESRHHLLMRQQAQQRQPTAKHLCTVLLCPSYLPQRPASQTTSAGAPRQFDHINHQSPGFPPPQPRQKHQPYDSCQQARQDLHRYQAIQTGAAHITSTKSSPSAQPLKSHNSNPQEPHSATSPYPASPPVSFDSRPQSYPSPLQPKPYPQPQPSSLPPNLRMEIGNTPPAADLIAFFSDRPASYDPVLLAQLPRLHTLSTSKQQATAPADIAARFDAALGSLSALSSLACLSALTSVQFPAQEPPVAAVATVRLQEGTTQHGDDDGGDVRKRYANQRGGAAAVGVQHAAASQLGDERDGGRDDRPYRCDGEKVGVGMGADGEQQGESEAAGGGGEGLNESGGVRRRRACRTGPAGDVGDRLEDSDAPGDRNRSHAQGQTPKGETHVLGGSRQLHDQQDLQNSKQQQQQLPKQQQEQPQEQQQQLSLEASLQQYYHQQQQQQYVQHVSDQQPASTSDAVRDPPSGSRHREPRLLRRHQPPQPAPPLSPPYQQHVGPHPRAPTGPSAATRSWGSSGVTGSPHPADTPSVILTTRALEGLIADTATASAASVVEQYHRRHLQQLQQQLLHLRHYQHPHQQQVPSAIRHTINGDNHAVVIPGGVLRRQGGGDRQAEVPASASASALSSQYPTYDTGVDFAFRTSSGSHGSGGGGGGDGGGGSGGGFQASSTGRHHVDRPGTAQDTTGRDVAVSSEAVRAAGAYQPPAASGTTPAWHGFGVPLAPGFIKIGSINSSSGSSSSNITRSRSGSSSCGNKGDGKDGSKEGGSASWRLPHSTDTRAPVAAGPQPPLDAAERAPYRSETLAAGSGRCDAAETAAAAAVVAATDLNDTSTGIVKLLPHAAAAAAERTGRQQSRWGNDLESEQSSGEGSGDRQGEVVAVEEEDPSGASSGVPSKEGLPELIGEEGSGESLTRTIEIRDGSAAAGADTHEDEPGNSNSSSEQRRLLAAGWQEAGRGRYGSLGSSRRGRASTIELEEASDSGSGEEADFAIEAKEEVLQEVMGDTEQEGERAPGVGAPGIRTPEVEEFPAGVNDDDDDYNKLRSIGITDGIAASSSAPSSPFACVAVMSPEFWPGPSQEEAMEEQEAVPGEGASGESAFLISSVFISDGRSTGSLEGREPLAAGSKPSRGNNEPVQDADDGNDGGGEGDGAVTSAVSNYTSATFAYSGDIGTGSREHGLLDATASGGASSGGGEPSTDGDGNAAATIISSDGGNHGGLGSENVKEVSKGSSRRSQQEERSLETVEVKDAELESDASGGLIVPLSLSVSDNDVDDADGSGDMMSAMETPAAASNSASPPLLQPLLPPLKLQQERTSNDLNLDPSCSDSNSAFEVEDDVGALDTFDEDLGMEGSGSHPPMTGRRQEGSGGGGVSPEPSDHSLSYSLSMSNLVVIGSERPQHSCKPSVGSGSSGRLVVPYGLASHQPYRPLPPPPAPAVVGPM